MLPWQPCRWHESPWWWKRCCSRIFSLSFLSSSLPHQILFYFFSQPWHKMVKWCSTAEFNFTVQLGPWLHCQIQINVHLTNMDQENSGRQPAVIRAIDSCVQFDVLSTQHSTVEIDWLTEFLGIIIYNFDASPAYVWPDPGRCHTHCGWAIGLSYWLGIIIHISSFPISFSFFSGVWIGPGESTLL